MTIKKTIQSIMQDSLRFHTPGHKGKLCSEDITELSGGKLFPAHTVELAQKKVAGYYGAKALRFLTHGSSLGIKASIMSIGGDILVPANSHQAIFEGAELARVNAIEIRNRVQHGLDMPLECDQIKKAIRENPGAKAVVVCSPDYYGFTASQEIVKTVKNAGLKLIVDSAHGAHFPFSKLFPASFSATADFCNLSAHKTLSAYTSSAYLAVNDVDSLEKIDRNLRLLGTTSPSYMFLAELENAADEAALKGEKKYAELKTAVAEFAKEINCLVNHDFTRIVVKANSYGLSGVNLMERLAKQKVYAELADEKYTVFIVTLADSGADIKKLERAIKACVQISG